MLRTLLPPWSLEGGVGGSSTTLPILQVGPASRRTCKGACRVGSRPPGPSAGENIVVTNVGPYQGQELEGLSLAHIAALMAKDPIDALMDLLLIEKGQPSMITFQQDEEDMNRIMRYPHSGLLHRWHHHRWPAPSAALRKLPRVLGHYVRERGLLSLEEAIRKMTSLPARILGFSDIGRIRVGAVADITIFDPDRIIDRATYDHPRQHPEGIKWVLVGGQVVVEEGEHTGRRPGRVLRKGR